MVVSFLHSFGMSAGSVSENPGSRCKMTKIPLKIFQMGMNFFRQLGMSKISTHKISGQTKEGKYMKLYKNQAAAKVQQEKP